MPKTRDSEVSVEPRRDSQRKYDLEERLLRYAAMIIRLVEELPKTRAGNHVAGQLLRAGTSPLPNHGEAQAAESVNDFIHKMHICLKELRESHRWLRLVGYVPLLAPRVADPALQETDELIRIFVASIRTAEKKNA
ncbi:MAG: four helix bundle protein [Planctomycetes bacterium]|nr:four helix bundle protein [Planctomycetota bacterium]